MGDIKKQNNSVRRALLKDGKDAEYKELVMTQIRSEEEVYQEIALEALSQLGIEEN